VACAIATGGWRSATSGFLASERRTLKTLNGVQTKSTEDLLTYARCYLASINASDLIVRLGGGRAGGLRQPFSVCSRPAHGHYHKIDVLLSYSGHFPDRVLGSHYSLNPWMLLADGEHPWRRGSNSSFHITAFHDAAVAAGTATVALDHATARSDTKAEDREQQKQQHRLHTEELRQAFRWIDALRGRTVAIVHPFNASIVSQLAKGGSALWGPFARYVMPTGITFKVVPAPQNIARSRESTSWREALELLIERVDAIGYFDVAMLSCGGLGMLLGAHLRATNRSAIYHGGDLQIWFGVYGRRWWHLGKLNLSFVRTSWVRPLATETPAGAGAVEGGTYWRRF
jgi:hypothetical protein